MVPTVDRGVEDGSKAQATHSSIQALFGPRPHRSFFEQPNTTASKQPLLQAAGPPPPRPFFRPKCKPWPKPVVPSNVERTIQKNGWARGAACWLLVALAWAPVDAADRIVGTKAAVVEHEVPDPNDPTKCIKVKLGEMAARVGSKQNQTQATMVGGWRRLHKGRDCCDSMRYLQVVLTDPLPPRWEDSAGGVHRIEDGEPYIDPLSGGNIGMGICKNFKADRDPAYDGQRADKKASETGDFIDGEEREYDLDNVNQNGVDWRTDPKLDRSIADRVPQLEGLTFATLLVCFMGKNICPIAGYQWGMDTNGKPYLKDIQSGAASTGLTNAQLQDALDRSGFGDFKWIDKCCPCVPEPSSLLALGGSIAWLAHRRTRRPPKSAKAALQ